MNEQQRMCYNGMTVKLTRALAALEQIRTACPPFGNGLPGINEHAAAAYRKCEAIAAKALAEIEGGEVPELETMRADAARYRYLKSEAKGSSPHMGGWMRLYIFRHVSNEGGAPGLDEAIDAKIAKLESEAP